MSTETTAAPSTSVAGRFQEERPTNLGTQFFQLLTTTDHKLIGKMYMGMAFAFFAFRLACFGLLGYGAYRLARFIFAPSPKVAAPPIRELSSHDPYYDAAVRELDAELGTRTR